MRILVFTTEPDYYRPLSERQGHAVHFAEWHPFQAQQTWVASAPDVLLLDVARLDKEAEGLAEQFGQVWPGQCPPLVVLCAADDWDAISHWLTQGADDYLTEPLHCAEVACRLHAVAERRKRWKRHGEDNWPTNGESAGNGIGGAHSVSFPATDRSGWTAPNDPVDSQSRAASHREQLFETIFQKAAVGLALAEFNGPLIRVNHSFAAMLGYAPEELEGRLIADVTHPEDVAREADELARLIAGGDDRTAYGKRYITRNGGQIWARLQVILLKRYADGRAIGFAVVENITAEKQATGELDRAQSRWQTLVDNLPDVLILSDKDHRITYANRSAVPGKSVADLQQQLGYEFTHPDDVQRLRELQARALATQASQSAVVRDVFDRSWTVRMVPIPPQPDGSCIMCICTDITEHVRMQDVLKRQRQLLVRSLEAEEAERRTFAEWLHDQIAQTLVAAGFNLESALLTLDKADNFARLERELANCREQIASAVEVCRRIAETLRTPVLDQFGLLPALQEMVDNHNARLEQGAGDDLPELRLAVARNWPPMSSLLENVIYRGLKVLIDNAIAHSGSPWIRVELRFEKPWVIAVLEDVGRGFVPDEGLEARADLALLAQRAKLLGGDLEVDSAPGQGARITLKLPYVPPAAANDTQRHAAKPEDGCHPP